MKMHWMAAVVAMLLAGTCPACALTLEAALAAAAHHNPTLESSRAAARARHEGVPLALSAWLPTIQASGSYTRNDRAARIAADGGQTTRSWELSYNQNLYRGGADSAALRRAGAEVTRSHAEVEDTEQRVFLQAATAYVDVIRARRTVALRETSLAAFAARVDEIEAQFAVGDRTRADLAQAQAEQEIAVADLAVAKADFEVRQRRFERLVGLAPHDLAPATPPAGLPATLDAALALAVTDHPSVRIAGHALDAAGHTVEAVTGEFRPRLDLTGQLARRWQSGAGFGGFADDTRDASVTLRATLPLVQAAGGEARLRQAIQVRAQYRSNLLAAQRDAAERTTVAWHDLHVARQRRAALEAAVAASRVALDGIRREAAVGERTMREVLDSERSLVSRQVQMLAAERDVVVRAYTLLAAVGALTARQLALPGVADLEREARETRWRLEPGLLPLSRDRD